MPTTLANKQSNVQPVRQKSFHGGMRRSTYNEQRQTEPGFLQRLLAMKMTHRLWCRPVAA